MILLILFVYSILYSLDRGAGRKNDLRKDAYDDFYISFWLFVSSLPITSTSKENRKKNGSYKCFFGFSRKAQAGSYSNAEDYGSNKPSLVKSY